MMRLSPVLLLLLLLAAIWPARLVAQEQAPFLVSADSLDGDYAIIRFPQRWHFNAADDPAFADPTYDDSVWPWEDTRLLADQPLPDGWQSLAWFRLPLKVDSALVNIPLGIRLSHNGTVLFMSDGFPELFNEAGEMLGYDHAVEVFAQVAARPVSRDHRVSCRARPLLVQQPPTRRRHDVRLKVRP